MVMRNEAMSKDEQAQVIEQTVSPIINEVCLGMLQITDEVTVRL